jgi:kynureninase
MQALIAQGVIGDFRAPNIMRFGITPLFTSLDDITRAVYILADIVTAKTWQGSRVSK